MTLHTTTSCRCLAKSLPSNKVLLGIDTHMGNAKRIAQRIAADELAERFCECGNQHADFGPDGCPCKRRDGKGYITQKDRVTRVK